MRQRRSVWALKSVSTLAPTLALAVAGIRPAAADIYSVRFCNNFSQPVYFAIAYQQTDGGWLSRGWMHVDPNDCGDFDTALRVPTFYFRAETAVYRAGHRRIRSSWGTGDGHFVVAASVDDFFNYYDSETKQSSDDMEPFSQYMSGHEIKTIGEFHSTITINADGSVNSSITGKGGGLVDGDGATGSDSPPSAGSGQAQGDVPSRGDRAAPTNNQPPVPAAK